MACLCHKGKKKKANSSEAATKECKDRGNARKQLYLNDCLVIAQQCSMMRMVICHQPGQRG